MSETATPLDVIEGRARWCVVHGDMVCSWHEKTQPQTQRDDHVSSVRSQSFAVHARVEADPILLKDLRQPMDERKSQVWRSVWPRTSRMEGRRGDRSGRSESRAQDVSSCGVVRGLRKGKWRAPSSRREHSEQHAREHRVRLPQVPLQATPEGSSGLGEAPSISGNSGATEGS